MKLHASKALLKWWLGSVGLLLGLKNKLTMDLSGGTLELNGIECTFALRKLE